MRTDQFSTSFGKEQVNSDKAEARHLYTSSLIRLSSMPSMIISDVADKHVMPSSKRRSSILEYAKSIGFDQNHAHVRR